MTSTAVAVESRPLYHSPRGLYEFQAEGVAYCVLRRNNLAVWDTGIGKSHLAMATMAICFEDDLIDLALVVCEKNKVGDETQEWLGDLAKFTDLDVRKYAGDPDRRKRILDDLPQVLVGTYGTFRNDAAHKVRVKTAKNLVWRPNFLAEKLAGKRVLVVYDEMTKLGNRSSNTHIAHDVLVKALRDAQPSATRVMGLTATPIERDAENYYNLGRILTPDTIGTVAQFELENVEARDIYGRVVRWRDPEFQALRHQMGGVLLRKRKTDPDVIDEFPKQVEEPPIFVDLGKRHKEFYEAVDNLISQEPDHVQRAGFMLLRQLAGHPEALLYSEGKLAREIVEVVGPTALKSMGSAKTDRLVEYLEPLVKGQGAQVVVFSFFGQSVLRVLDNRLREEGFTVALHHGQLSEREANEAKRSFRAGEAGIFLSSDAGQRGINLPNALYVVNYEYPLTHAAYIQRINRSHRIDSIHPTVTCQSFIARDTVEEPIASLVLDRNEQSDIILEDVGQGGKDFLTAQERRRVMEVAKKRQEAA